MIYSLIQFLDEEGHMGFTDAIRAVFDRYESRGDSLVW